MAFPFEAAWQMKQILKSVRDFVKSNSEVSIWETVSSNLEGPCNSFSRVMRHTMYLSVMQCVNEKKFVFVS